MMPFLLVGRRRIALFGIVMLAALAGTYLLLFWNVGGPLGVPVEKVRSIFVPANADDYSSNTYRAAENINLWRMVREHPLGVGFGHPFEITMPLADLSEDFPNWRYHPHNMIFGLWMALGSINFVIFLCYVGSAMMTASLSIKLESHPQMKAAAVFCVVGIATALLVTNLDQFIWAQRGALFTGFVIGLAGALAAREGRLILFSFRHSASRGRIAPGD
jgi:hypothetical protein